MRKRTGIILAIAAAVVLAALLFAIGTLAAASRQGNGGVVEKTATTRMTPVLKSSVDRNGNGVDDYSDIVAGARVVAEQHPTYDDGYYQGGYPPEGKGACTDLVVEAFANAGYDLKAMVDADILNHPDLYPDVSAPDPNIDYRRTGTLDRFFSAHATSLTTDVSDTEQWQQGDIVVFETTRHIGVVSDTRGADGVVTIIHNNRQKGSFEDDYLNRTKRFDVSGHYRFDAAAIPADVLKVTS